MEATSARSETTTARRRAPGLSIRRLGRVPYAEALEEQHRLRDARLDQRIGDTILLLEHPDVITFGRGARPGNAYLDDAALERAGYDVARVNRGGDVTYHGPGQLVGYPILDLSARGRDVHVYLRQLEGALIATLGDLGVAALRRDGFAGVWLDERRKIASIGVGVRRWVTMHGFALNVSPDLARFDVIRPCGLDGIEMTSVAATLGRPVDFDAVVERCEARLLEVFG